MDKKLPFKSSNFRKTETLLAVYKNKTYIWRELKILSYKPYNKNTIMSLEKTLVILKPSAVQRGLIGEITSRFERKGLRLAGMKMMQLTEEILNEHYAHLAERPFFARVKASMMASPVIVCCYEGVDAIQVVRSMTGATNGRVAIPGTIRGDFSMSSQENIIHTSDSPKTAATEVARFFQPEELFEYQQNAFPFLYYTDEYQLV